MFGSPAKVFLSLTAVAPMLGALSLRLYLRGDYSWAVAWLVVMVLLVALCRLVLWAAEWDAGTQQLVTESVKSTDAEVLAFLLAYMLPLLGDDGVLFTSNPLTAFYMFVVIFLAVHQSNAYHFNPLLSIVFHYHFYQIETKDGIPCTLISKRELLRRRDTMTVVKLGNHLYVEIPPKKAN